MSVETDVLSLKDQAIKEIEEFFSGHDNFIINCKIMIASVDDFRGIYDYQKLLNELFWEKNFKLTIRVGDACLKSLYYRKGTGHNIKYHDYSICTIDRANGDNEVTWSV